MLSVRHQIAQSYPDPGLIGDMPRLHYVLRGIKSEEAKKNLPPKPRLPVTPTILIQIYQILRQHPEDFDNIMLWSAFLLCFFGFLRSGEITIPNTTSYDHAVHLNFSDIVADHNVPPNILQIKLKASKTDPFHRGINIHIGRTNNTLCPVTSLLNYLTGRGNAPGLLFHFKDHSPLTKSRFTSRRHRYLTLCWP